MNQYGIEFKRKTPVGYKKWGTDVKIYAESDDEANVVLNTIIEPFIEEKLGEEVIELSVIGQFVVETDATSERPEQPDTEYMEPLNSWFYIPMLDTYKHILSTDEISDLVTFFIGKQEYEICDQLNEIRKEREHAV